MSIAVYNIVSRRVQGRLPWELLYANDLVLMSRREAGLKQKLLRWRNMKEKGLEVSVAKTEVMIIDGGLDKIEEFELHPCEVYGKDIGNNSIKYMCCMCFYS